jgi:hypothetical protein
MEILDSFAQIDWAEMGSPQLPLWVGDLLSGDEQTRVHALDAMINHHLVPPECFLCANEAENFLEIGKCETSCRLTPYLIALLERPEVHGESKHLILELLIRFVEFGEAEEYLPSESLLVFQPYLRRLYRVVRQGTPIYRDLLTSHIPRLRDLAASLLDVLEGKYCWTGRILFV